MAYDALRYWRDKFDDLGAKFIVSPSFDYTKMYLQSATILGYLEPVLKNLKGWILDFGCGVGRFAPKLCCQFDRYVGADIIGEALALAPKYPNARYRTIKNGILPIPDGQFDVVLAVTVLQHIVGQDGFLRAVVELRRMMKPRSKVILVENFSDEHVVGSPHVELRTPDCFARSFQMGIEFQMNLSLESTNSHRIIVLER